GLDVNGTGSAPVWYNTGVTTSNNYYGYASRYIQYFWDGTNWVFLTWGYDANTTYSNAALGQGYATQSNTAASATITATLSSYALTANGIVSVKFNYDVPAGATLNINSKGAKAIYNKDAAITAGVIKAGDTATFIYNTYYRLISVDSWQDNTGGGSSGTDTQQVIIKMVYDDDEDVYSFTDVNDTAMTNAQVIQLLNDTDKDVKIKYNAYIYHLFYREDADDEEAYYWDYFMTSGTAIKILNLENYYSEGSTDIGVYESTKNIPTNLGSFGWGQATQNNTSSQSITASCNGFQRINGGFVVVRFNKAVNAGATLNINGTGATSIYKNGAQIKSGVIPANCYATFVYNSGAYYLIDVAIPKSSDYQIATPTNNTGTSTATYNLNTYGCHEISGWGNNDISTVIINLSGVAGTEPVHTILFNPQNVDMSNARYVYFRYNGANVQWYEDSDLGSQWAHFGDDIDYIMVKVYNCQYATHTVWRTQ
ncbi:MAG: hypothetical protein IKY15_00005, partial [Clostridia bacterium]|nr:hypothetical protein [Clostridia bacterium]